VEWSAEVEQIRGYLPGTVTPTTQLVLSHKHPDDYQYIAATLEDILGFPRNRGGFLYAASGWMAAIFSYSTGGSNPAELWRRRVL